jgi:hypothetical protein
MKAHRSVPNILHHKGGSMLRLLSLTVLALLAACPTGPVRAGLRFRYFDTELVPLGAPVVPRYRFKVGQRYIYRAELGMPGLMQAGYVQERRERTVWVVDSNTDGSWHIVMLAKETRLAPDSTGQAVQEGEDVRLVRFDMFSDGRHLEDPTLEDRDYALTFPPLPKDRAEATGGWLQALDDRPDTVRYSEAGFLPEAPGVLAFRSRMDGLLCDLTESERSEVLLFDTAAGVYQGMEGWWYEGGWRKDTAFATLELAAVDTLPAAEVVSLKRDAEMYFKAWGAWHALCGTARKSHTVDSSGLADAERILRDATARISDTALRSILERSVGELRSQAEREAWHACHEHPLVGKPAPGWELEGLAGDTYRLSDCSGRIVILCFWSRESGDRILALHAVNGLASRWDTSQVAVFGMHLRPGLEEAELVRDRLSVDFPMLEAAGSVQGYHAHTHWPVYVVDRLGVARAVLDWSPEAIETELPNAVSSLLER